MFQLPFPSALYSDAAAALAQTTVQLDYIGYDVQGLKGSVVGVDATATTFALSCPSKSSGDDEGCAVHNDQIFTYGPSTMVYSVTKPFLDLAETHNCQLHPAMSIADCTASSRGLKFGGARSQGEETVSGSHTFMPLYVTVTAGAEKLMDKPDTFTSGAFTDSTPAAIAVALNATDNTVTVTATPTGSITITASSSSSESSTSSDTSSRGSATTHNKLLAGIAVLIGSAAVLL